jgi:hypothetical protein
LHRAEAVPQFIWKSKFGIERPANTQPPPPSPDAAGQESPEGQTAQQMERGPLGGKAARSLLSPLTKSEGTPANMLMRSAMVLSSGRAARRAALGILRKTNVSQKNPGSASLVKSSRYRSDCNDFRNQTTFWAF